MKPLIKVMLILGAVFAATFVIGRIFGILTVENVKAWLEVVQSTNPAWVAGLVIGLLFIDLFVAVPTLTITLLAGFFLGFPAGMATALSGMSFAAFGGYAISLRFGESFLSFLVREEDQREDLKATFQTSGPVMILLSRAAPIAPEVTACMAGATRMPFLRYLIFFLLSTVPYVAIAAYAGSISSADSPRPAILASIFLYGVLWIGWFFFRRHQRQKASEVHNVVAGRAQR